MIRDPEKHWRQHAPAGYEDAFAIAAAKYRGKSFGEQVASAIERDNDYQRWIDLQIVRARRLRRARRWSLLIAGLKKLDRQAMIAEIPDVRLMGKAGLGLPKQPHKTVRTFQQWLGAGK